MSEMQNITTSDPKAERHYRVVRYYSDFAAGLTRAIVAQDLTLEEAHDLAARSRGAVPGEDIVVQDQLQRGLDADVE